MTEIARLAPAGDCSAKAKQNVCEHRIDEIGGRQARLAHELTEDPVLRRRLRRVAGKAIGSQS
jgi:hypothetical protein